MCRISVYHLCQEKTFVAEYKFPYYEGEVSECTYFKAARLGLFYQLYYQGLNKIVVLAVGALLLTNLLTVLVKMVYSFIQNGGDMSSGWAEFTREMRSALAFFRCCCGGYPTKKRDYNLVGQDEE